MIQQVWLNKCHSPCVGDMCSNPPRLDVLGVKKPNFISSQPPPFGVGGNFCLTCLSRSDVEGLSGQTAR